MSLYLRLVIGPIVVCDIDLFSVREQSSADDPPAQLAGGTGTLAYPDPLDDPVAFGFTRRRHPKDKGYSAQPSDLPKPPPPPGRASPSRGGAA